jgi:hypothetical protein
MRVVLLVKRFISAPKYLTYEPALQGYQIGLVQQTSPIYTIVPRCGVKEKIDEVSANGRAGLPEPFSARTVPFSAKNALSY